MYNCKCKEKLEMILGKFSQQTSAVLYHFDKKDSKHCYS